MRGRGVRGFDNTTRGRGRERQLYTRGIGSGYKRKFNLHEDRKRISGEDNQEYTKPGKRFHDRRHDRDRGANSGFYKRKYSFVLQV